MFNNVICRHRITVFFFRCNLV
ncbi:hypothetical protein, partial [Enterococcus gallinarum]